MIRILIVAALLCLLWADAAIPANPQCASYAPQWGGHIGLYVDPSGHDWCMDDEILFATNTIYIVHVLALTGNSVQFAVATNWNAPSLTVSYGSNLTLGELFQGVAVTYVGCKQLPYVIGTLSYVPVVHTPPCTYYFRVVADPSVLSGDILTFDCDFTEWPATGGHILINTTGCDPCGGYDCPVAAEPTSWGRVKSLYQ